MPWFLAFEGSMRQSQQTVFFPTYIVKEMALLHEDGERCYNYFITGPKPTPPDFILDSLPQRHRLRWEFGDYEFYEALEDIESKVGTEMVFVKEGKKCKFVKSILPSIQVVPLGYVPPFTQLNDCLHKRCKVKHGNFCARRKVHEIRHYAL